MPGPVLLVHDDISIIAPAKRVLQKQGIDSVLVTNAADGVIAFGDLAPEVVVLAAEVDGGRGVDVYKEIRNHPRGAAVHFVFLGHGVPEAPEAAVVPLPLDGQALLDAVERAFEGEDVSSAWHLAEPAEPAPAAPAAGAATPAPSSPEGATSLADSLFSDPVAPGPAAKPLAESLFEDLGTEPEAGTLPQEGAKELSETLFGSGAAPAPEPSQADRLADEILAGPAASPAPAPEAAQAPVAADRPAPQSFDESQKDTIDTARLAAKAAREAVADKDRKKAGAGAAAAAPPEEEAKKRPVKAAPHAPADSAARPASRPSQPADARGTDPAAADGRGEADRRRKEPEAVKDANRVAQEDEKRAHAERERLEAEAAEIARRREEARKRAEAAARRLEAEARKAEELRKVAEDQKKKVAELRSREEAERARVEELKGAAAEEERRVAEERKKLEAEAAEIARRREELRRQAEAEKKKLEEEARRVEELQRVAEENRQRAESARAAEEAERARVEALERAAAEEEERAARERERLQAEAEELARRREEARKKVEAAQRQLASEESQAEVLLREAEEQKRRISEVRNREEAERRHVEELKKAALEEEQRARDEAQRLQKEVEELQRLAEEARQRLQSEAEELARRKAEAQKAAEEAQARLAAERAAIEEEEKRARELAEAAARELTDRAEKARQAREAREEELRRARELRLAEQEQIKKREEEARQALEGRRAARPPPAGKWRGPLRLADRSPAANDAAAEPPPRASAAEPIEPIEPIAAAEPGEGFKTGPPVAPTEPPFAARGTLAQLDLPSILCRAFDGRLTGRIDVAGLDAQRTLWFEEGRLVAAASTSLVERLEDVALRAGLITAAQHHALRTSEERLARRLALQMVELGYIRPNELYPLVRRRVLEIAYSLFLDDSSTYLFSPESPPAEERVVLPMHPYALATDGIRRKFSTARLWARLGGPATLLRPRAQGFDLDYFGLSARERRLVGMVDGLRTIEEILFEGGLDEGAALKVLYALAAAGTLEIAVLGRAARPDDREEAARLDLSRVAEKYNQAVTGDYFQILGLRRDVTSFEVRESYERLVREFHPDRFLGLDDPTLLGRLEEIGRSLAEAADVLADDAVREEYARSLLD